MHRSLAAICLAAALSACTTLNPVTAARLSRIDPLTADPSAIVARLDLPEGLAIRPGGAVLSISATRKDSGESFSHAYRMEPRANLWALSTTDAAALRKAQALVARWKQEAPEQTSGAISLSLTGCGSGSGPNPGPNPQATISADLSLDAGTSFLPLIRGLTVAEIARAAGTGPTIGPCTDTAPLPR